MTGVERHSPAGGERRAATMADVAQRVGVSRQLVGLVFRDEAGVSAETRGKILAAAGDLGYSPNIAARSLRRPSTKYLGVIFDPAHSAPMEIIEGLYSHAHASGYNLVVSALTPSRTESDAILELLGYRCEALILIAPRSTAELLRAAAGRLPVVVIGRGMPGSGFDVVRSQGDEGIDSVVHYLAALGHTAIAYVHGVDMLDSELRLAGYRSGMSQLSLATEIVEVHGDYTEDSGARAAQALLDGGLSVTAIICNNDQAALGLTHRLLEAGIRVPQRVSVTGFDDSRIARFSFLNLTTVRQDPEEVSLAAVTAAVARISGAAGAPAEVFTSARLVVRQSTAAAPTTAAPH